VIRQGWSRLRSLWSRVVARPTFQARASGFWLTRPIALRRTRDVFDLTAGFVYAQTLLALVRLSVLERLLDGPQPEHRLADDAGIAPERYRRLVDAAVSVALLRRRRDGTVELGKLGAPLAGNDALRALVEHNAVFYRDLADPVALLRGDEPTELSRYWPYTLSHDPRELPADAVEGYSRLMARSQPALAAEVLHAYDFSRHRVLVDIGGGAGVFVSQVARRHPHLDMCLVDLPGVAEHARRRFETTGDSVVVHPADFFRDPLPAGADVVTLVRIIHDHDDDDAVRLLRRVRTEVLAPGGTLVVAEPMSGVHGSGTVGPAYFSLYLLAMGQGRPRTPAELADLLREAGFASVRRRRSRAPVLATVTTAVAR
jgi:demethylspheroidene O-methyltransferase